MELFHQLDENITFIDDSKATNVASSLEGLKSVDESKSLIVICGGRSKDQDFKSFTDYLNKRAKKIYYFGESTKILKKLLDSSKSQEVSNLEEAVHSALKIKLTSKLKFRKFSSDLLEEKFDLLVIALSLPGIDFIRKKLKNNKIKIPVLVLTKGLKYLSKKKKILSIKTDKNGYFKTDEFDAQNCYLQIDKKKESATVFVRSWPNENKNLTDLKIKLSKKVPLFKAEIIPKINPKIVAIKIEEIAKTTVFGKVSLIIVETFTPLR